jgi:CDP-diacylglycerol--serine O-phosphatidyltransferase
MYSEIKYPDFKGKGNPMYAIPVAISFVAGLFLLFLRPVAWPFA